MKEGERGPFFPKLRVRIKDNNSSPHGKFYRFLFPFSSKFSDLNFALYVLYIYLHTVSLGYPWFISYCHDVTLSAGCSIDDRDSGSLTAYEFEIFYQLLSRRDSFGGLFGR